MNRLWSSQKHLQFCSIVPCDDFVVVFKRLAESHPIALNDLCPGNDIPAQVILKVISRFKNLVSLRVISSRLFEEKNSATRLANVLNDNCISLEHLHIRWSNLVLFELYRPSAMFTCLWPSNYGRLSLLYNKKMPIEQLPLKLIGDEEENYKGYGQIFNLINWNSINKLAAEHLIVYYHNLAKESDVKFNECINLKFLNIVEGYPDQIRYFHQLEHI